MDHGRTSVEEADDGRQSSAAEGHEDAEPTEDQVGAVEELEAMSAIREQLRRQVAQFPVARYQQQLEPDPWQQVCQQRNDCCDQLVLGHLGNDVLVGAYRAGC